MIDWTAKVSAQAALAHGAIGTEAPWSAMGDPGDVPAPVMPALCSLAQRYGYDVKVTRDLPEPPRPPGAPRGAWMQSLGCTGSRITGGGTIFILAGMSPASTARVLAHELGHVLHTVRHGAESVHKLNQVYAALGIGEDVHEETACELGSAAFCAAAGIGTGQFLKRYLGQHSRGHVSQVAIDDAALNAEALWEACVEYEGAR